MSAAPSPLLLEQASRGNADALAELIELIIPSIEKQLTRYPVTDEDRRDLLQTTLLQIMRRIGTFRAESSFSTWLFRVTANEALMLLRSRRRRRARFSDGVDWEELENLPRAPEGDADDDLGLSRRREQAIVQTALDSLPDDYRAVVHAHYHLDLGLQEIADRMHVTESSVRSRLHRARSRLRSLLEPTAAHAIIAAA